MAKFILVRHGQTDWNVQRRFQGQHDVPLNEVGRKQAAALSRRLAGERIHTIYASDLQRVTETAEHIVQTHQLTVQPEPRLREMSFGDWEGLTYAQIGQRYPKLRAEWEADMLRVTLPGGESLMGVASRVRDLYDQLVRDHQDETVLLAAHGGSLRVLLGVALGLGPERYWQFRLDTASLTELYVYPEGPILTRLNDTAHLRDGDEEAVWEG